MGTMVPAKTICVVGGGGPAGLAALKVILDSPEHKNGSWKVVAFEGRETVGGIWLPALPVDDPPLTPLYDSLTTNLPHSVMCYTSYPFPPSTPIFPVAAVVQSYLESFADHFSVRPYIQFRTAVTSVSREFSGWVVGTSSGESLHFDAVLVCNGHYRVPRYPGPPGLDAWIEKKVASHSAWYRHPERNYSNVVVVGSGPSGTDITSELRQVSKVVIQSMTDPGPSEPARDDIGELRRRGHIRSYHSDLNTVEFEDGSIESGIEKVYLATGFLMTFPFLGPNILHPGIPPTFDPPPGKDTGLWNAPQSVFPLARHVFSLHDPTLAFLGLPMKVAPFPVLEAQAAAVVGVLRSPSSYDIQHESNLISVWYRRILLDLDEKEKASKEAESCAVAEAWHRFKDQEQFGYRDELYAWAGESERSPEWVKEIYPKKDILRKAWNDLVAKGQAEDFVRGVGEKSSDEWVPVLRKLLKHGENL